MALGLYRGSLGESPGRVGTSPGRPAGSGDRVLLPGCGSGGAPGAVPETTAGGGSWAGVRFRGGPGATTW